MNMNTTIFSLNNLELIIIDIPVFACVYLIHRKKITR